MSTRISLCFTVEIVRKSPELIHKVWLADSSARSGHCRLTHEVCLPRRGACCLENLNGRPRQGRGAIITKHQTRHCLHECAVTELSRRIIGRVLSLHRLPRRGTGYVQRSYTGTVQHKTTLSTVPTEAMCMPFPISFQVQSDWRAYSSGNP